MSMRVAAALAGFLGPILFLTVLTLAGLMRSGYEPVSRYASDLAVGETGWLQTANFIGFGCFVILFAAGLTQSLVGGRALRVSAVLLALTGLALIVAGVFPTDLIGQPATAHGAMHFVASLLMFGTLDAVFFVMVVPLRQDERWAGYARYSTITGVVAGGLCLASAAAALPATFNNYQAGPLAPWTGLVQRALFVVAFGWIAVVGLRLLLLSLARSRRRAHARNGRSRAPDAVVEIRGAEQARSSIAQIRLRRRLTPRLEVLGTKSFEFTDRPR